MAQPSTTADELDVADEPATVRRTWSPGLPLQAALLAGGIILVWWVVTYWPTAIDPSTVQPGPPGDGWGGTAFWQAIVDQGLNPFKPGTIDAFNAPDGVPVSWQVFLQQWPTTLFQYGVTWISGDADVAMNAYLALGVVGTAASMGWFVARFVVADRWIAVLSGVALTLTPMITTKAAGHTAFAHLWPIVLMVGAVLIAWERPSWRSTAVAGFAAFVAMSWSGYHLLLAGTVFAALLVLGTLVQLRGERRRTAIGASARIAMFAGLGLVLIAAVILIQGRGADPVASVRQNSLDALYVYSARWYEYLVPTADHWLLGGETASWLESRRHGSNGAEQALYQGVTLMLLGLVGLLWLLVPRLRHAPRPSLVPTQRSLLWIVGPGIVVVGGVFSLPPMVSPLGISLPTPSRVIFEFVTSWRVYSRFSLVVSMGMVVVAALGLRYLAGDGRRRIAVLVAASVLIPLDLAVSMQGPQRVDPPAVSKLLRQLPPGILATYPLERGEFEGYGAIYGQQFYGHPVLNGYDDQPEEARADSLKDLTKRRTAERLSALGVRYVLAVQRPGEPGDPPVPTEPHKLFERIGVSNFGPWRADIYQVPQLPGAFASLGAGFAPPEGPPTASLSWATGTEADIDLAGSCSGPCRGGVRISLVALGQQRITASLNGTPLPITSAGGKQSSSVNLSTPQILEIPVEFDRQATVTLTADPGPIPVQRLNPGSPDQRSLSFASSGVRFVQR